MLLKDTCPIFVIDLKFTLIVDPFRRVFLRQGIRFWFNLYGGDCNGRPYSGKKY
jgi:hypothetical protein